MLTKSIFRQSMLQRAFVAAIVCVYAPSHAASWTLSTAKHGTPIADTVVSGSDAAFMNVPSIDLLSAEVPLVLAQATSRPQPAVSAQLKGPFLPSDGFSGAYAAAFLTYKVTITSTSGAIVPVRFISNFGVDASGSGGIVGNGTFALVLANSVSFVTSGEFGTFGASIPNEGINNGWDYSLIFDGPRDSEAQVVSKTLPLDVHWVQATGLDGQGGRAIIGRTYDSFAFEGTISGIFPTTSSFDVSLFVSATAGDGALRSYIDPYFYIDSEFLSANPSVRLSVESLFGNAPPVPEPGTGSLCALGISLLFAASRHRRHV